MMGHDPVTEAMVETKAHEVFPCDFRIRTATFTTVPYLIPPGNK